MSRIKPRSGCSFETAVVLAQLFLLAAHSDIEVHRGFGEGPERDSRSSLRGPVGWQTAREAAVPGTACRVLIAYAA